MPIFALIPGFNGRLLPKQDSNVQEASEFFNGCSCLEINVPRVAFDALYLRSHFLANSLGATHKSVNWSRNRVLKMQVDILACLRTIDASSAERAIESAPLSPSKWWLHESVVTISRRILGHSRKSI
jgi:hypothetical protein